MPSRYKTKIDEIGSIGTKVLHLMTECFTEANFIASAKYISYISTGYVILRQWHTNTLICTGKPNIIINSFVQWTFYLSRLPIQKDKTYRAILIVHDYTSGNL